MWRIVPRLYLGDHKDASDLMLLHGCGITHILNCAAEVPRWYPTDFRYLHLKLRDPDLTFIDRIPRICGFIRAGRKRGGVLVHCIAGLSRSPSAILAYLRQRGMGQDEALDLISRRVGEPRSFIEPDAMFLEQIEAYFDDGDL